MAIVKMKKLRLLAMSADRQALLKELLLLGCVEVSEPTELPEEAYPALSRCDSAELTRVKAQHAELTNAVKLLDKYSPEKSGFLKPLPRRRRRSFWTRHVFRRTSPSRRNSWSSKSASAATEPRCCGSRPSWRLWPPGCPWICLSPARVRSAPPR